MNSEKVSVNINDDKLSKIDLLVSENFYANRSVFINEAIDSLLAKKEELIEKLIEKNSEVFNPDMWFIGMHNLSSDYLNSCKEKNVKLKIRGFGILYVDIDVSLDLFKESVEEISKKIVVRGNKDILDYLKSPKE